MQYLKGEIREKIVSAAIEEFKVYGYADAAIRNIANNASISLGNIYRYFTNKEALYFAIVNPFMESIDELIEKELLFKERTMGQVAKTLADFVIGHANELMVIRKGNTVHYAHFIKHIVDAISGKVHDMLKEAFPQIDNKINNPEFSNVVAESFLTAIFKVLRDDATMQEQERNTREVITFFFGQLSYRFNNFEA